VEHLEQRGRPGCRLGPASRVVTEISGALEGSGRLRVLCCWEFDYLSGLAAVECLEQHPGVFLCGLAKAHSQPVRHRNLAYKHQSATLAALAWLACADSLALIPHRHIELGLGLAVLKARVAVHVNLPRGWHRIGWGGIHRAAVACHQRMYTTFAAGQTQAPLDCR
jgi:hypothetical protein